MGKGNRPPPIDLESLMSRLMCQKGHLDTHNYNNKKSPNHKGGE